MVEKRAIINSSFSADAWEWSANVAWSILIGNQRREEREERRRREETQEEKKRDLL